MDKASRDRKRFRRESAKRGGTMRRRIEIKDGTVIKIRALRWDDGWEFDCPTAIIAPVLRVHEDGSPIEYAIEDLCIDGCINGFIEDQYPQRWDYAPGGSLGYLNRKFYRDGVEREQVKIRFFTGKHGLEFEDVDE